MGRDTPQNLFMKQMHRRWWNELGKKGKPRGLIQGITSDKLDEALDRFGRNRQTDTNSASRELFFELSSAQIKKSSVEYFVDSTPLNIQNADRISRLLPESLFINMIRDGRDVALSVSKERWGPKTPEDALDWWQARIERSARALSNIPKEKYLTLRLEDLIEREREETYRKIHIFLDLPESNEMRDYFEQILTSEKMSRGSWSKHVKDPKKFDAKYTEILQRLASKDIEIERYY
jgi:hypothetical protein